MKPEPIIKFNNGNPIVLCNRCFVIICQVSFNSDGVYVIRKNSSPNNTELKVGSLPPAYCDKCEKLLAYSLQ